MAQLSRFITISVLGLVISEILLVMVCYSVAILIQFGELMLYLNYEAGWARVGFVTGSILFGLYLNDCYERVKIHSRMILLQQLCLIVGAAFLLQAVLSYGNLDVRMPRQAMVMGSGAVLIVLPLWRTIYGRTVFRILGAEKLLFVGTHPLTSKAARLLRDKPEFRLEPAGFVIETAEMSDLDAEIHPVLGTLDKLTTTLKFTQFDRLIIGLRKDVQSHALLQVIQASQSHSRVEDAVTLYETISGRVPVSEPVTLETSRATSPLLQTLYSTVIGLAGLILAAPLMILTVLLVRVTSKGPVLYRQVRAGKNNQPFTLYKFRSMYEDAEKRTGAVWAQENDPRITPLGRYLRKFRVDELPQLLNVLKGEMSIVGPRPERPEFVEQLAEQIPLYMQRLRVKPGITGWAQVNYRYGNTLDDTVIKLEYDLYYIKHLSPQLDFYIMFHTIKTILLTRGAY